MIITLIVERSEYTRGEYSHRSDPKRLDPIEVDMGIVQPQLGMRLHFAGREVRIGEVSVDLDSRRTTVRGYELVERKS